MDADTTITAAQPSAQTSAHVTEIRERRGFSGITIGVRMQRLLLLVGALILLGVAFYAGRAYQNNIDQKLFNAYNPPTSAAGAGFRSGGLGAGAGSGQNSLVRAALGAGSPPGTKPATSSGSQSGAGSSTAASGSATGSLNRVVGSVGSIKSTSMSLQTFQGGTQTVALSPQTRFYQTVTASITALTPGEHVTISASGGSSHLSAVSITVGPTGLTGAGRGLGRGGFSGTPLTTVSGTITSVATGSISVSGTSSPISMSSSTRISRIESIRASQLKSGAFVTATLSGTGANQVASTVVERNSSFRGGFSGSGGFSGNG